MSPCRAAIFAALAVATLVVASGCRTAPIRNVERASLDPPPGASLDDVSEAIWRAGRKLGWDIEKVGPGELVGTLRIRRHRAVVSIEHDRERFSIRYRDSENLLHEEGRIHENYNHWVQRLADRIEQEPIYPGSGR